MINSQPFVSIIIVNYNGRQWLELCLPSVFAIDYPQQSYEVIVIDNASQDNSVSFIQKKFPQIKLIQSESNSGFTGGNNLGIDAAQGEYIVLLNSDTQVDEKWLSTLVKTARKNPKAGIIQSKLLLGTAFTTLHIESTVTTRSALVGSTDHQPLGILIEKICCSLAEYESSIWYDHGCLEPQVSDVTTRWTTGDARVCIPYLPKKVKFELVLRGYPLETNQTATVKITLGSSVIFEGGIEPGKIRQLSFDSSAIDPEKDLFRVVQNAGNQLLHSGYSKDLGSILRFEHQKPIEFYEKDSHFFDKEERITAACGASCLIKKSVIDQIGGFDGHYFMYYEDLDFSVRAWKVGWDIVLAPESLVYHHHMGSTKSGNWLFFHFLIQRNHILFVLTHYPIALFVKFYAVMWLKALIFSAIFFAYHFRNNIYRLKEWEERSGYQWQSVLFILRFAPHYYRNRLFWLKRQVRDFSELSTQMF